MVRTSDGCCVLGLKSTPQAVCFGLACAAIGALAASLSWGSLEMEVSLTPELSSEAHPVSVERAIGHGAGAGQVAGENSCCNQPGGCPECNAGKTCGHAHECDDCAFCRARAKKALQANAPFVPLHERPEYPVESPDVLHIAITGTDAAEAAGEAQHLVGEHLIAADGTIELDHWGKLHVAGQNVAQIKHAIEERIDAQASGHEVAVKVHECHSLVYFVVIDDGWGDSDTVSRYPARGNETALDAIASAGNISDMGRKRIWIARPTASGVDKIIPITWRWTSPTTMVGENPLLLPGDRVYLSTPPSWVAFVEKTTKQARTRQASRAEPVQ